MVDQVLLLLQALFLLLLYLFVWRVVRTASRDLRLPQESFLVGPAQAQALGLPVASPPGVRLVVEASPSLQPGEAFAVSSAPLTVGRSGENAIALPNDDFASARHARVEPLHDGLWVVDLGSTNGTAVNGRRIDGRLLLHEGDMVRIGATELRVARG